MMTPPSIQSLPVQFGWGRKKPKHKPEAAGVVSGIIDTPGNIVDSIRQKLTPDDLVRIHVEKQPDGSYKMAKLDYDANPLPKNRLNKLVWVVSSFHLGRMVSRRIVRLVFRF